MKILLSLLTVASLVTACASEAGGARTTATSALTEAPDITGTWRFDLASSDVAGPLRERCAKDCAGDAAKTKACVDAVAVQAAREKVRFAKEATGTVWTSFEIENDKEVVYLQVPVELTGDGPGRVLAKVSGPPNGTMAAQFEKSSTNALHVEVVDPRTIVINDPRKGRLVYTKE